MKPWFILIGLAVGLTAATTVALPLFKTYSPDRGPTFAAPPKPDGPAPVATIEEDLTYKFDVLPHLYKGKHSWVIKNTGAGPLELRGSSSTCSCTNSDLFDKEKKGKLVVIPPGESMPVPVNFETRVVGHYHQTVTIATNDPARPEIKLVLDGKVRPAITTVPADPSLNFATASNEEPTTSRVYLYSEDQPDIKILRMVSSNPEIVGVESRPLTPEEKAGLKTEKGYALEVTVKPSTHLGNFAEEVTIETDHPMKDKLKFPVRGRIIGPISLTPDKVTMRGATSSNGGSAVLSLWARGRSSVNFVVEKKPPGMEVAIEPIPTVAGLKGSKYKMTVKLIPGIESGQISDEIVLKTDDPKVSELRVPVEVLVQGAR